MRKCQVIFSPALKDEFRNMLSDPDMQVKPAARMISGKTTVTLRKRKSYSATLAVAATQVIPAGVPVAASSSGLRLAAGRRTTESEPGSQTRQVVPPQRVWISMTWQSCPWSGL